MTHLIRNAFLAVLAVGVAGCEWSGGGDDNSWNDSGTIANFNGNYHASGGYLVSDYTSSSSSSTGSSTTVTTSGELNVLNEAKGTAPAVSFNGICSLTPVKPGSFHLYLTGGADGQFTDNGGGALSGEVNIGGGVTVAASGNISYDNGAYSVSCPVSAVNIIGKNVTITYTQLTGGGGSTTTTSSSGDSPGSSGVSILAFNVQQTGNKIKIIDNNGSIYEGSLGDMRTTGNSGSGASGDFVNGDQVIASFSAGGKSKSGMYVNLTGNFQGTVEGVTTQTSTAAGTTTTKTSMALSNRRIMGTWIEDGGKTGNISGVSDSAVNVVSTSTEPAATTATLL
jgi:hypothetical protein